DRDGWADIVTANRGSSGDSGDVSVMLSNRNGTFRTAPSSPFTVEDVPGSLVVADINRDRRLDLIIANNGSKDVSVLLGSGGGSFQTQRTFAAGSDPSAVAVEDVNRDGRLDLIIVNQSSNDVTVLPGNGDAALGREGA